MRGNHKSIIEIRKQWCNIFNLSHLTFYNYRIILKITNVTTSTNHHINKSSHLRPLFSLISSLPSYNIAQMFHKSLCWQVSHIRLNVAYAFIF